MSEIINFSFGPLTELLKDLFPPGCRLSRGDGQTHGLDWLDQSWEDRQRNINNLLCVLGLRCCWIIMLHYFIHGLYLKCKSNSSFNSHEVFKEQLNQLSWEWLSTEQPPPLTHAHRGCSSTTYWSSMARVYVATDDKLLVSAVSSTAPVCAWASSRSTLLHWGSRGPPDWLGDRATPAQESPSAEMQVSSSRTAGAADPAAVFPGPRSETSSEMKLSLVTLGIRGLGVSSGWSERSAGASAKDSGEVKATRQLAPSVDTFSVSDSTSLTTDWARTSPQK